MRGEMMRCYTAARFSPISGYHSGGIAGGIAGGKAGGKARSILGSTSILGFFFKFFFQKTVLLGERGDNPWGSGCVSCMTASAPIRSIMVTSTHQHIVTTSPTAVDPD